MDNKKFLSHRIFLLLTLAPTMVWAAFTPPATILLDYRDIELASNGGFKRTNEWMVRIDTQQGVDQHGQAKLYFDGKRAKQTVVEAYLMARKCPSALTESKSVMRQQMSLRHISVIR